jgi:hypothetical protein
MPWLNIYTFMKSFYQYINELRSVLSDFKPVALQGSKWQYDYHFYASENEKYKMNFIRHPRGVKDFLFQKMPDLFKYENKFKDELTRPTYVVFMTLEGAKDELSPSGKSMNPYKVYSEALKSIKTVIDKENPVALEFSTEFASLKIMYHDFYKRFSSEFGLVKLGTFYIDYKLIDKILMSIPENLKEKFMDLIKQDYEKSSSNIKNLKRIKRIGL